MFIYHRQRPCHFSNFIRYIYVVILSCILLTRDERMFIFIFSYFYTTDHSGSAA
jgi:hypothetical protein